MKNRDLSHLSAPSLPSRPVVGFMTVACLALLLILDARESIPINPYAAPAPVALGSNEAPSGAHCTNF